MKKTYTKILSLIVCLLCGISAIAHDFESGGIYYNITDETAKTVEVTWGENKYTGNVRIPSTVAYNGFDYSVTSIGEKAFSPNSLWKSLGMATFTDVFTFYDSYKVEVQQNELNPAQFRLVRPYHEGLAVDGGGMGGPQENTDEYLYFNILQPGDTLNGMSITKSDLVFFDEFNTGYVHPSYGAEINLCHPALFTGMTVDEFAWNKVLSYQDNGLPAQVQLAPIYYMYGVGGYDYHNKPKTVLITFPGVKVKDYSVDIEYVRRYTDESNNVYAEFNVSMGKDVKEVKVGMAITENPDAVLSGILDGSIETTVATEAGTVRLPLNASGKYTVVALPFDDEGNYKSGVFTQFEYRAADYPTHTWKSLGMAQYTDGFICSLFDIEPVTYSVELQESEDAPGLYRLVNPYGEAYPYNQSGDWDTTQDYFLVINATDPNGVYIETQKLGFDWGYGMFSASSMAAYQMENNGATFDAVKAAGLCGTLQDGVITFPTQGLLLTAPELGSWYYANVEYDDDAGAVIAGSGNFKVVFPSEASKSSKSVKATKGNKSMAANKGSIKLHKNAQKLEEINVLNKTTSKIYNSNKQLDIIDNHIISTDNSKIGLNLNRKTTQSIDAFETASELISVTIPNSVTKIDNFAFEYCSGLKELIIEDGADPLSMGYNYYSSASNGEGLFYDCPLEKLYLGRNLTYYNSPEWGTSPFCNIRTLKEVTMGNSITEISAYAFYGCTGLTSVTIPNSVTVIGDGAFYGCSGLTEINIPDSVTVIGDGAFYECSGLTSIVVESGNSVYDSRNNCNAIIKTATNALITGCKNTIIPNSVTSIGDFAFYRCSGLTSVTIPNSVTVIGEAAFYGCSGLTSVTIPNSVTSIGSHAFYGCSGLTSVTIPNSVTSIGSYAFSICSGLTSVTIPNSVTSIGSHAFFGCSGLTSVTIPNSVTVIEYDTFAYCSGLTSVTIPNSVTSIGSFAFSNCSGLTSVTIPNSVTVIGEAAFYGCSGLTSVTIPNSVTEISAYAFFGCSGLTSVTIPNSVTVIEYDTFAYCSGLTSVTIPNSVTSIGSCAFSNCSGLTSVTIPNSVTVIGDFAFGYCSLNSIKSLNTTPPACDNYAFDESYDAVLEVPADAKDAYSTAAEWCNFSNIIEIATVEVSTQENNAIFEIPTTQGAVTYTVNVYSDEAMTQLVATTNYDATGKIIPMATSLELSIDGFDDGTYYYNVVAKTETGETLSNYTGSFEINATGISQVAADNNATEVSRYDIHGQLISEPTKGINIVKYSDGTTRKEIVK